MEEMKEKDYEAFKSYVQLWAGEAGENPTGQDQQAPGLVGSERPSSFSHYRLLEDWKETYPMEERKRFIEDWLRAGAATNVAADPVWCGLFLDLGALDRTEQASSKRSGRRRRERLLRRRSTRTIRGFNC